MRQTRAGVLNWLRQNTSWPGQGRRSTGVVSGAPVAGVVPVDPGLAVGACAEHGAAARGAADQPGQQVVGAAGRALGAVLASGGQNPLRPVLPGGDQRGERHDGVLALVSGHWLGADSIDVDSPVAGFGGGLWHGCVRPAHAAESPLEKSGSGAGSDAAIRCNFRNQQPGRGFHTATKKVRRTQPLCGPAAPGMPLPPPHTAGGRHVRAVRRDGLSVCGAVSRCDR